MNNSKIAVIGTGKWGINHVKVANQLGCLGAVCDTDLGIAKKIGNYFKTSFFSSLEELVENKIDACILATPTPTHYKIAKKILGKGINLLVEKPLSPSYSECKELVALSKNENVVLQVGFVDHFNPIIQRVKDMIEKKTLGEILMTEFHRENRAISAIKDENIFSDVSVHDIESTLNFFNRLPKRVYARLGEIGKSADFATIVLEFENKTSIITSNRITPKKVRLFSITYSEGIINGDIQEQTISVAKKDTTINPRINYEEPLSNEIKNFLDAINGKDNNGVMGEKASEVTLIAELALKSALTNSPVEVIR